MKKTKFINLSTVFPQWIAFLLLVLILFFSFFSAYPFSQKSVTAPSSALTLPQTSNFTFKKDSKGYYYFEYGVYPMFFNTTPISDTSNTIGSVRIPHYQEPYTIEFKNDQINMTQDKSLLLAMLGYNSVRYYKKITTIFSSETIYDALSNAKPFYLQPIRWYVTDSNFDPKKVTTSTSLTLAPEFALNTMFSQGLNQAQAQINELDALWQNLIKNIFPSKTKYTGVTTSDITFIPQNANTNANALPWKPICTDFLFAGPSNAMFNETAHSGTFNRSFNRVASYFTGYMIQVEGKAINIGEYFNKYSFENNSFLKGMIAIGYVPMINITYKNSYGDLTDLVGTSSSNPDIYRTGNNFYIKSAKGLNLLAEYSVAYGAIWKEEWNFFLLNDIDMSSYTSFTIGSSPNKFTGVFDGQGHSITMSTSTSSRVALFSYTRNVTIKNVTIKGKISGNSVSSAFIAEAADNIEIINCRNEAKIYDPNYTVGGCIGYANGGVIKITNFVNVGELITLGKDDPIGGVIGECNASEINISKTYIDCKDVKGNYVGGLIGMCSGLPSTITVSEVAVNANLISDQSKAGGFVGTSKTRVPSTLTFTDCYFNGTGSNYLVLTGVTPTYKGVFDGQAKKYYSGFNDEKWVTGVNGGTAGLRSFLAVGSLAPVIDVETYLVSKGFKLA